MELLELRPVKTGIYTRNMNYERRYSDDTIGQRRGIFFSGVEYSESAKKKRDIPSGDGMNSHQPQDDDRLSKSTKNA